MAKSPVKEFIDNKIKNFLLSKREELDILNVMRNENKLVVFFDKNKDFDLQKRRIEISNMILLELSKYLGKEISNLPLISYIVNEEGKTLLIEV